MLFTFFVKLRFLPGYNDSCLIITQDALRCKAHRRRHNKLHIRNYTCSHSISTAATDALCVDTFAVLYRFLMISHTVDQNADALVNQRGNHRYHNTLYQIERSYAEECEGPYASHCRIDSSTCCQNGLHRHKVGVERKHHQGIGCHANYCHQNGSHNQTRHSAFAGMGNLVDDFI